MNGQSNRKLSKLTILACLPFLATAMPEDPTLPGSLEHGLLKRQVKPLVVNDLPSSTVAAIATPPSNPFAPITLNPCPKFNGYSAATFDVQVELPNPSTLTVNVADYGADATNLDNRSAFQKAIDTCISSNQPCTVTVPSPAIYKLQGGLNIKGASHLTVDGKGSRLVFAMKGSQWAPLFTVQDSNHVLITNLGIDWNWGVYRIATLGQTVSYKTTAAGATWTVDFKDIVDLNLATIFNWDSAFAIDPTTFTMGMPGVQDKWNLPVSKAVKLSNTTVALSLDSALDGNPQPGDFYLFRHFGYEVHGLWLEGCTHCTLDNVNLFSTPGKAITIEDLSSFVAITDSRVGVFPGSLRHMSSATDGIHISGSAGNILIRDTEVSSQGDDCLNVHDPISVGFRALDKNTILISDWRPYRIVFAKGDTVEIHYPDYSSTGFTGTVAAASYGSSGWTVRFTSNLPTSWQGTPTTSLLVFNTGRYNAQNILVRGLNCHSNRARGAVIQAKQVVIEQSCFRNIQLEAVTVSSEIKLGRWAEGTGSSNVMIYNNLITAVDKRDSGHGAIYVQADYADQAGSNAAVHTGILIQSNNITSTKRNAIVLQNSANVLVTNNIIHENVDDVANGNIGVVYTRKSNNVRINSNQWIYDNVTNVFVDPSPSQGLTTQNGYKVQIETGTSKNVAGTGNTISQ